MSVRLPALVLGVCVLLGTATALTYAANKTINTPPAAVPAVKAVVPTLVVPDVQRQAYVFAKGILEDGGFAWRVKGSVRGFAANVVATQTPAPGTRVVDNGAPTILLTLSRNGKYGQEGAPEDTAPYAGTPVQAADLAVAPTAAPTVTTSKKVAKAPAVKQAPVLKPAKPQARPPAFVVKGAPKEPLDEMPLVQRATLLKTWLDSHPKPTNANVSHWLYQHEWVVQGAKFGWWHGAEALRVLIQDDRAAERVWGIGAKSRSVAQATLTEVLAAASRAA